MPMDAESFQRSLQAAAKLCEPTNEEKIRNAARNKQKDISAVFSEGLGMDGGVYDNTAFLTEPPAQTQPMKSKVALTEAQDPLTVNKTNIKNSKLPPAILAHLQETESIPVDPKLLAEAGFSEALGGKSILTSFVPEAVAPAPAPTPQVVTERVITPQYQGNAGIDYTALKAIINECLDAKLKEYSKQMLSESTLRTIGLKEGKIRLVDNSGNIYQAKLERTGNINDKKK